MTKQTLEELIEMQKAIAICECIINDIVEGYKLQLKTPRTEEEVPDFMREDMKKCLQSYSTSTKQPLKSDKRGAAMKAIIKKPGEKTKSNRNRKRAFRSTGSSGRIYPGSAIGCRCLYHLQRGGETYRTSIQHKNPERDFCGEYSLCGSSGRRILQLDKRADQPDRRESFEQGGELNENPCCKEDV